MIRPDVPHVAMISDAARGIGATIARELHAGGWCLSLGLRDPAAAPVAGDTVLAHRFDPQDPAAAALWRDATLARFGRIDGLVLNAGAALAETAPQDGALMTLAAPMRLAQLVLPALEAAKGRIVVLSALSGAQRAMAPDELYERSKFAVDGLASGLRQCGQDGAVRTTAIRPSFVAADTAAGALAAAQMTPPEDLARIVRIVLELPPTASLPEIPVHYSVEDCL